VQPPPGSLVGSQSRTDCDRMIDFRPKLLSCPARDARQRGEAHGA
jgi:hypothetical protein